MVIFTSVWPRSFDSLKRSPPPFRKLRGEAVPQIVDPETLAARLRAGCPELHNEAVVWAEDQLLIIRGLASPTPDVDHTAPPLAARLDHRKALLSERNHPLPVLP